MILELKNTGAEKMYFSCFVSTKKGRVGCFVACSPHLYLCSKLKLGFFLLLPHAYIASSTSIYSRLSKLEFLFKP